MKKNNLFVLVLFAMVGCSGSGPSAEVIEKTTQSREYLLKHVQLFKKDGALKKFFEKSHQKNGLSIPPEILEKLSEAINELIHESNFDHQEGNLFVYNVTCDSMGKIVLGHVPDPEQTKKCKEIAGQAPLMQIGVQFGEDVSKLDFIRQDKKLISMEIGSEHISALIEDSSIFGMTGSIKLRYEMGTNISVELKQGLEIRKNSRYLVVGPMVSNVNLQTGEQVMDVEAIRWNWTLGEQVFPAMTVRNMFFEDNSMKCHERDTGKEIFGCEQKFKELENAFTKTL